MADIFLSYNRKDIELMQRLYNDLQAEGFTVWIDEAKLEPGTPSWQRAIEQAINESRCMIVIMSPDAKQSKWVEIEATIAEDSGHRIFPVLARGDENNAALFRLRTYQWIDLRQDYEQQVKTHLLPALRKYLTRPPATKPVQKTTAPPQKAMTASAPPPFLGFEWVTIPAGEFTNGRQKVNLPEYRITTLPVKNFQYKAFLTATGYSDILREDQLAASVEWNQATRFCEWASQKLKMEVRLPTANELRKAMLQIYGSTFLSTWWVSQWTSHGRAISDLSSPLSFFPANQKLYSVSRHEFRCVVVPTSR